MKGVYRESRDSARRTRDEDADTNEMRSVVLRAYEDSDPACL
jgi:hypothetical protein